MNGPQQDPVSVLKLDEMFAHHADVQAALRSYFSPDGPEFEVRFFGELVVEVERRLRMRLQEADQQSSLVLLTSLEAAFRLDYQDRVHRRRKDDLSRSYRELYKRKGTKVQLDGDLFEKWKAQSVLHKQAVANLRSAFKFRHWMAHGRYWNLDPGRYTLPQFYDLALQVSELMNSSDLL